MLFNVKRTTLDPRVIKASFILLGFGTIGSIIRTGVHTVLCDQYIDSLFRRYRFGMPIQKLQSKLEIICDEVLDDLELSDKKEKFNFFPCLGFETMYLGLHHIYKSFIGLPFNFDYQTEKDVNKNEIVFFNDQAPNWKLEDGKEFLKNLVLSKDAKKYAIAESVHLNQSGENYIRCCSPFAESLFSAMTLIRMYIIFGLTKKPMSPNARFAVSVGIGVVVFLFTNMLVRQFAEQISKEKIDQFLDSIKNEQNYIDGGLEYYSKLKRRNQLLRGFMGEDGKKLIKSNGDLIKFQSNRYSVTQMIENISRYDDLTKKTH